MNRNQQIIKTSFLGIIVNIVLVVFKIIVGIISNSIAIILDAVNNLSDAVSSIITIVGTRLAEKPADRQHPFGYGRIEYLTSIVIAILILFTGFSSAEESFKNIMNPAENDYTLPTFVILVVAVIVKLVFGLYLKKRGNALNAQSLQASGTDSIMDAFVSLSTLVAAVIYINWKINIDGYLGLAISLIIIKTGFDILRDSIGGVIGNRSDSRLVDKIMSTVESSDQVLGAYDLILNDYGPNQMIGSIHIEVSDKLTAVEIDRLSREITTKLYKEFGLLLTVGIYATNTTDKEAVSIKQEVRRLVKSFPEILQFHGFFINLEKKFISFDVVINFGSNRKEIISELKEQLKKKYPEYTFNIFSDTNYSLES